MRSWLIGAGLVSLLAGGASPLTAQPLEPRTLQLSFDAEGRVNLSARNVTVREILQEWARQCGCYVVNADRLPGEPLTLPIQFENALQNTVLESLLRQAAGYVLTPKRPGVQSVSNYETIYILATSTAVTGAYVPPPPLDTAPPLPTAGAPDDEIPPVLPPGMLPTSAQEPAASSQQAPSNPFRSRTSGPNAFTRPDPFGRDGNTTSGPAPGAPTPVPTQGNTVPPPAPMPMPAGSTGPLPSGAPVPIIAVPPQQGR
jgi:hypothetical protein